MHGNPDRLSIALIPGPIKRPIGYEGGARYRRRMPLVSGPTPARQQLLTLLRGFMQQILPAGTEIILGQANRVPEPTNDNFVCLIPMGLRRMSTTAALWNGLSDPAPTTQTEQQDVQVKVQVQVFGDISMDNANVITTLLRSPYACAFFNSGSTGIAPLNCDDAQQIPFIDGESQYEDRWIMDAMFEMSVSVVTALQFADSVVIEAELVEALA